MNARTGRPANPSRRRFLSGTQHVFCLGLLSLLACTPSFLACGQPHTGAGENRQREPQSREPGATAQTRPVILLTGFEPFGAGKPPNPSWEGIKSLDGQEWSYVNPDVGLALHRIPDGPWLGMRSIARQHPSGIGFADSLIFDRAGPVGRVGQSQILEPRAPSRDT